VLDDDVEQPGFAPAEALLNAPAQRDNQFLVPKVVDDA
jgi:Asp-tRNA(Asn)/Glu-tRNA(Gln) amidotransferase C subunit